MVARTQLQWEVSALLVVLWQWHTALAQNELVHCLGNREFTLIAESVVFDSALNSCAEQGKVMGGITSFEENELILDLALGFLPDDMNIWIGEACLV